METPGTAWDIRAIEVTKSSGVSMDDARNYVIMERLKVGDTRPFADWIMCGHRPSPGVLRAVAVMMTRGDNQRFDPAGLGDPDLIEIAEVFPLSLVAVGNGKRKGDLDVEQKNRIVAREFWRLRAEGVGYGPALDQVTEWLSEIGIGMSRDAVEKASKQYRPKACGTNSGQSVP